MLYIDQTTDTCIYGAGLLGMKNLLQEIKDSVMFQNKIVAVLSLIEINKSQLRLENPTVKIGIPTTTRIVFEDFRSEY